MEELYGKNNPITLRSSSNGFTVNIMNIWNSSLNFLIMIILPNVWNDLSDDLKHCFSLDYLIAVRLFTVGLRIAGN